MIPQFEVLTWQDIRHAVKQTNPELGAIIDELSPDKNYRLIKCKYKYGDYIVDEGKPVLPTENGLKTLDELLLESKSAHDLKGLTYSQIPLLLLLHNTAEVFTASNGRIIPLNLFFPGSLLGLFETVDYLFNRPSNAKWCVSSGSRSILMLPKITDKNRLKNLRLEFNLPADLRIKSFSDHWHMFKYLANHKLFPQQWESEVVFFTVDWFENKNDPVWHTFFSYLFQQAWKQAQNFLLERIDVILKWEKFVEAIANRHLKPNQYISDHVKYLISMAMGNSPGFIPAYNEQNIAPVKGIQNIFMDIYLLKYYQPTLMYISSSNTIFERPVYYSLAHPTLLEGSPEKSNHATLMLNLKEIKLIMDTLADRAEDSNLLKHFQFDYFHVEKDKFAEIKITDDIRKTDATFQLQEKLFSDRVFCATSPFWRGCIRISRDNTPLI